MVVDCNISAARKAQKLSVSAVSRRTGINRQRLSGIESGESKASIGELNRIAGEIGCSIVILNAQEMAVFSALLQLMSGFVGEKSE